MNESLELRVYEEHASRVFAKDEGLRLSEHVRKIVISTNDPRLPAIEAVQAELCAQRSRLFAGWYYHRRYAPAELRRAQLLTVAIPSSHLFSGEEAGSTYDEASACPVCGAGRKRTSPLRMRLGKLPRVKDIVRSSTDEWIVSARLVEAFRAAECTGADFVPIEFRRAPKNAAPQWYELIPTGAPALIHTRTVRGVGPFPDPAEDLKYSCPLGDTLGFNRLSELYVGDDLPLERDVMRTRQFFGSRMGMFCPTRELILSGRAWRALTDAGIAGLKVEVAHIVPREAR
jgi:hypothetical protein